MGYQMNRFLTLGIANSLVAMGVATAVTSTPAAANTPVCYMQTETGQTIDLSHLCGATNEQTVNPPKTTTAPLPQRRGRGAARRSN